MIARMAKSRDGDDHSEQEAQDRFQRLCVQHGRRHRSEHWITRNGQSFGRISIDPAVCGGKPCIRGTRIWVSLVLDVLASGTTEAELLAEYPQLDRDDVLSAITYVRR